ncbi:HNH endonuclease [Tsukamurella tyrosinosolvens]|nr:HNH endonuclease [Tsukamurella tyrosinosolvens]
MEEFTMGTWPTTAARSRLVVLRLWDGRCGHCGTQLVRNRFAPTPRLFEVDHYIPRNPYGGIDAPTNYVASCHDCNHARSNGPVPNPAVHARMARVRSFVNGDSFNDFVRDSMRIEHSTSDGALVVTVRCLEHGWHVENSPDAIDCFERCTRELPLRYRNAEWWSRFGEDSAHVLAAVQEYLHITGLNRPRYSREWRGLHLDLPRYARSPHTALSTLDAMVRGGRDSLSPAAERFTYGRIPLSGTNDSSARTRSTSIEVAEVFEFWKDHGVTSIELLKFWMSNQCPTDLLGHYFDAVDHIQRTGVRKHILALSEYTDLPYWDRVCAFTNYLARHSDR